MKKIKKILTHFPSVLTGERISFRIYYIPARRRPKGSPEIEIRFDAVVCRVMIIYAGEFRVLSRAFFTLVLVLIVEVLKNEGKVNLIAWMMFKTDILK